MLQPYEGTHISIETLALKKKKKDKLTVTCYMRMNNRFPLLQSGAHHIITRPIKLDKTVSWVGVIKTGGAGSAGIPIGTIQTFPTYACDTQLAYITRRVMHTRLGAVGR